MSALTLSQVHACLSTPFFSPRKKEFAFYANQVGSPPGEQISVPAGPGGRAGVVWGRQRELGLQQQKHFLEMYFPEGSPLP